MLHLVLVGLHQLVVFVHVDVALLAHLLLLTLAPARLNAQMLVHLRFEDAELIQLRLGRHTQTTVTVGTVLQTRPEVRELINHPGIVAYGPLQVACLVEQQGTVEDSHDIVRLLTDDEVEIVDGAVVVAHLHTQLTAVIMCQEVIGIQFERLVVIGHGAPQVIDIVARQGTVHVVPHHRRLEMNGFPQLLISIFPFLTAQTDHCPYRPSLSVVGIQLQRLIQERGSLHRIFLLHAHLRLQLIHLCIGLPPVHHRVELEVRLVIILVLNSTEGAVEPKCLTGRIMEDGHIVIGCRLPVFLHSDAANATQVVDARNIRIQVDGLATIHLRSLEIIQVVFGHGTIEPRLIKIRFSVDYLVEILHGEHIVFIVKSAPTRIQHPVDIVLRMCSKRKHEDDTESHKRQKVAKSSTTPTPFPVLSSLPHVFHTLIINFQLSIFN